MLGSGNAAAGSSGNAPIAAASAADLLSASTLKLIGDARYEKRKAAALEVEQVVKRLAANQDHARIRALVDRLISEFAFSPQANHRKGALLCLAAAAVGLGDAPGGEQHLRQIVPPILASFTDQDARVRYYACEALYNVGKSAREGFVEFFPEVFDATFRLCADPEPNVQSAVQFLDSLVKDIVTASPSFRVGAFVPKLRDYLKVLNPYKRQFLVSWVAVLDSVPDLDMLRHLPALLDGLMSMLSDPNREIRAAAHKVLMEFLCEAQASIGEGGAGGGGVAAGDGGNGGGAGDASASASAPFDCAAVVDTLVARAQSPDELTRMTALRWLQAFLELAAPRLARSYPAVLGVVLPNVSHPSAEVRAAARSANDAMLALGGGKGGGGASSASSAPVDTAAVLAVISREVRSSQEATRLEALRWVHFLLVRNEAEVFGQLALLLSALLDALGAPSERTVLRALAVLGQVAAHPQHFRRVLSALVDRFRGDEGLALLQRGGPLVIRRLCAAMGAARVFGELASLLDDEEGKQQGGAGEGGGGSGSGGKGGGGDLPFASAMVQALNLVLLTASETRGLRDALRRAGGGQQQQQQQQQPRAADADNNAPTDDGAAVFRALYPAWCHSCGASLSLCLLSGAYGQARAMVEALSSLPLGAGALVELDRLVQLLEAPAFAPLRLGLLEDGGGGPLSRALYALLMVLPQSSAFRTLSARLAAAAPAARAIGGEKKAASEGGDGGGDWSRRVAPDLLALFVARQEAHAADEARRRAEAEGLATEEDIRREHREQAKAAEAEAKAAAAAASGAGAGAAAASGGGAEAAAAADGLGGLTLQPQQSQ